ncbi:hypothetical protein ACO0RG_000778 [Hanseniaspora osmophila]
MQGLLVDKKNTATEQAKRPKKKAKKQVEIDETGMIMVPPPRTIDTNKDHYQRINYLNQLSYVVGNEALERLYNKNINKISQKTRCFLSPDLKLYKCKKCLSNLKLGDGSLGVMMSDTLSANNNNKSGAVKTGRLHKNVKSHVLKYRCLKCGNKVKNFYIGKNIHHVSFQERQLLRSTECASQHQAMESNKK